MVFRLLNYDSSLGKLIISTTIKKPKQQNTKNKSTNHNLEKMSETTQVQIPRDLNSHSNKTSATEKLLTLCTPDTPRFTIIDLNFDS